MSRRSQHSNNRAGDKIPTQGSYSSSTGDFPEEIRIAEPEDASSTYGCTVQNIESMTGPIPSPRALKGYAELDSTLPDRIVKMAEKQLEHEISIDQRNVDTAQEAMRRGFASATRGQWMELFVILTLIACSVWMGLTGHEALSYVMIGSGIAAAGAVFVKNLFSKE